MVQAKSIISAVGGGRERNFAQKAGGRESRALALVVVVWNRGADQLPGFLKRGDAELVRAADYLFSLFLWAAACDLDCGSQHPPHCAARVYEQKSFLDRRFHVGGRTLVFGGRLERFAGAYGGGDGDPVRER